MADLGDEDLEVDREVGSTDQLESVDWCHVVDRMLAAALLELDLEAARRRSRRIGPVTSMVEHRKEREATTRANRSTLNEIAASLGVSRSMINRMLSTESCGKRMPNPRYPQGELPTLREDGR